MQSMTTFKKPEQTKIIQSTKKLKKLSSSEQLIENLDTYIKGAKEKIEETRDEYPLNYKDLKMFLENSAYKQYRFNKNTLQYLPDTQRPKDQNRITRLRKKLKKLHNSKKES